MQKSSLVNRSKYFLILLLLIVLCSSNKRAYAQDIHSRINEFVMVSYSSHVQKKGWTDTKKNGERSGTVGSGLRMEAIKIDVSNIEEFSGDILYRSHIQTYGWESWKRNGEESGTVGEGKRLEAIQIKLTGELRERYDIYYRVHVETFGWLDWGKNGESVGTSGYSKRMEAIEIMLVDKGSSALNTRKYSYIDLNNGVRYSTHIQTYGWQQSMVNGATSGTLGKSKRMEAIRINMENIPYEGSIEYQSHIQTYGWENNWKKNGEMSGTEGQGKRLEAIKIRVTGELAEKCDIYYRVHTQHFGWLGWAKNGEPAGTEGLSYRMEAIQILLLPKEARNFENVKGYIDKKASNSILNWELEKIVMDLGKKECFTNTPINIWANFKGTLDDNIECTYIWKNNTTGESGNIDVVLKDNVVNWTPILSGDYTITVTAIDSKQNKDSKSDKILVRHGNINKEEAFFTAHRGLSSQAPGNSEPAFRLAGKNGFKSIETDINETKDGVFIITHDNNLLNVCGINKKISELTYSEIKDYNVYHINRGNNLEKYTNEELRLLTLEEYLDICKEYNCIPQIDTKCLNSFDSILRLYDILCDYGIQNNVIITSFNNLYLQLLRNLNQDMTLTYGVDSAQYLDIDWLINYNIGISVNYQNLITGKYKEYIDKGIAVNAYTLMDKQNAGILIELGITSITTEYILWE